MMRTDFKQALFDCGMSGRGASRLLGVSYHTIKSWTSGRRKAPQETVETLRNLSMIIKLTLKERDEK